MKIGYARVSTADQNLDLQMDALKQQGADFASVQDGFDTSSASGKMVFSVIGAMAEYERYLIRERTIAGLAAAVLRVLFIA